MMSDFDELQRWHNAKYRKCDTKQHMEWLEWGLRHYWVYHPCPNKCRSHERSYRLAELVALKERQAYG
mgnify:CR=1 FL=1